MKSNKVFYEQFKKSSEKERPFDPNFDSWDKINRELHTGRRKKRIVWLGSIFTLLTGGLSFFLFFGPAIFTLSFPDPIKENRVYKKSNIPNGKDALNDQQKKNAVSLNKKTNVKFYETKIDKQQTIDHLKNPQQDKTFNISTKKEKGLRVNKKKSLIENKSDKNLGDNFLVVTNKKLTTNKENPKNSFKDIPLNKLKTNNKFVQNQPPKNVRNEIEHDMIDNDNISVNQDVITPGDEDNLFQTHEKKLTVDSSAVDNKIVVKNTRIDTITVSTLDSTKSFNSADSLTNEDSTNIKNSFLEYGIHFGSVHFDQYNNNYSELGNSSRIGIHGGIGININLASFIQTFTEINLSKHFINIDSDIQNNGLAHRIVENHLLDSSNNIDAIINQIKIREYYLRFSFGLKLSIASKKMLSPFIIIGYGGTHYFESSFTIHVKEANNSETVIREKVGDSASLEDYRLGLGLRYKISDSFKLYFSTEFRGEFDSFNCEVSSGLYYNF